MAYRDQQPDEQLARLQDELQAIRAALEAAEDELAGRMAEIYRFERQVDARLGDLSAQLEALENEIAGYLKTIERQRNVRLFGKDHPFDRPDYWRNWEIQVPDEKPPPQPLDEDAETLLRDLYRQLARHYHPDLAEDEDDRAFRSEKMRAVNKAFANKSLAELKYLALEAKIPTRRSPARPRRPPKSEVERLQQELARYRRRLGEVRAELDGLHNHPSVQLSLDVKLARRQGRDLLGEMARDLRRQVARKMAERDFLKSQIDRLNEG